MIRLSLARSLASIRCLRPPLTFVRRAPVARRSQLSYRSFNTQQPLTRPPSSRKTIYALATPPGKAGVAVIRISGPNVEDVYTCMIKPNAKLPKARLMERAYIRDVETGEKLDSGLVVYFKAPKSFTAEDVLELHVHSGRAIIASILTSLSKIEGCRPAEAGEFTRRAFDNGRLDLTQVEGLRDLINAETDVQRRLALRAAEGGIGKRYDDLRERIIYILAMVEAIIDFGEGEEIEDGVWERARDKVSALQKEIQCHLDDSRRGEILRSGVRLAIFGPPNAGKSSLLNYLAQREAAIVTPLPGTTRDVLEVSLDIGGMPVIVADTAGLRKTSDLVESIGVERAQKTIESSDIALCVLPLPDVLAGTVPENVQKLITPETLVLLNKSDLAVEPAKEVPVFSGQHWRASVANGQGMKDFMAGFVRVLRERFDADSQSSPEPLITEARHRVHLQATLQYLDAFMSMSAEDVVFAAEELRYAAQEVGKVCGSIGVEDILDTVFKEFCIGK